MLELKWFIEPAGIREVRNRSKEIIRGIEQVKKISSAWKRGEESLRSRLDINDDFEFIATVASVTSIGSASVQDEEVPVIKVWHLVDEILKSEGLGKVMDWLRKREYLPKKDVDFRVVELNIKSGEWSSTWYGIEPIN